MTELVEKIASVFESSGHHPYGGEKVTELEHALQAAQLAEQDNADEKMIVSAFLHDIGHLIAGTLAESSHAVNLDDHHEDLGFTFLKPHFDSAILDPIRLHVAAKRYLCTVDNEYQSKLSECSLKSFHDQGGPMSDVEKQAFEAEPHFERAVQLRHYDDQAKVEHLATPGAEHYLAFVERQLIQD